MDKWLIKIPTNKSATPSQPSCGASNPTSSKTKKKENMTNHICSMASHALLTTMKNNQCA